MTTANFLGYILSSFTIAYLIGYSINGVYSFLTATR